MKKAMSTLAIFMFLVLIVTGCAKDEQSSDGGSSTGPLAGILNIKTSGVDHHLYLGVQGNDGKTYIKSFTYNSSTNAFVEQGFVQLNFNNELRAIDINKEGNLIAANTQPTPNKPLQIIDITTDITAPTILSTLTLDDSNAGAKTLNATYGVCTLPNGNMIASSFYEGINSNFGNEYTEAGVFIRNVWNESAANTSQGMLNNCLALSDNDFVFIEAQGNAQRGFLRRFQRSDTSSDWTESSSLSIAQFDTDKGTSNSGAWMMAVDTTNRFIYMPSYTTGAGQFAKMIRCSIDVIAEGSCAGFGDDLPTGGANKGLAMVPDSNDVLLFSGSKIYRLNASTGAYTEIADLSSIDLGTGVSFSAVWGNPVIK